MNRKGIDYAVWLTLVTILCLVYLYVQLQTQLDNFQVRVGESQVALLNAYQEGDLALLRTDVSARYAVQRALYSLAAAPGGCGETDGYPLWSTQEGLCVPDLFRSLEASVNAELAKYVKDAPGWRVLFNGTDAIGTALAPIEIAVVPPAETRTTTVWFLPIAQETYAKAVIGTYAVRPSFRVRAGYDFGTLALLRGAAERLSLCAGEADVPRCLDSSIPPELPTLKRVRTDGDTHYFRLTQAALRPYNERDLVFGFALRVP